MEQDEEQQSPEDSARTILAFKKKFRIQMVAFVLFGAAIITLMLIIGSSGLGMDVLKALCIVVIIATVITNFRNWRCPACGRYLFEEWYPKSCSKCGAKFRK